VHDPFVIQEATIDIACDRGVVELAGDRVSEGRARVRLDHPIEIRVTGAELHPLRGVAADGREVRRSMARLIRSSPRRGISNEPRSQRVDITGRFEAIYLI
jgi:hypothetical protein